MENPFKTKNKKEKNEFVSRRDFHWHLLIIIFSLLVIGLLVWHILFFLKIDREEGVAIPEGFGLVEKRIDLPFLKLTNEKLLDKQKTFSETMEKGKDIIDPAI